MKHFVIPYQALAGKAYEDMLLCCEGLTAYTVWVFKGFALAAKMAGKASEYNAIMNKLKAGGVTVRVLPECYGPDELFYLLKDKAYCKKIGFNGTLFIGPCNTYSLPFSADILGYTGKLKMFEFARRVYGGDVFIKFQDFKYQAISKDAHWLDKGLNTSPVPVPQQPLEDIFFCVEGKKYTEPFVPFKTGMQYGAEGYVYAGKNGFMVKIWWSSLPSKGGKAATPQPRFVIEKLEQMTKIHIPGAALPKGIVRDKNGTPLGFVMDAFEGEHIDLGRIHTLQSPLKYMQELIREAVSLDIYSMLHRDFEHNILYSKALKAYILDLDSIQFNSFPATTQSRNINNGLPFAYQRRDNRYYASIDLSYELAILMLACVTPPLQRKSGNLIAEDAHGNTFIPPEKLWLIRSKSPLLAALAEVQYNHAFPAHFTRWAEQMFHKRDTTKALMPYLSEITVSDNMQAPTKLLKFRVPKPIQAAAGAGEAGDPLRGDYYQNSKSASTAPLPAHNNGSAAPVTEKKADGVEQTDDVLAIHDVDIPTTITPPHLKAPDFGKLLYRLKVKWAQLVVALLGSLVDTDNVVVRERPLTDDERILADYALLKKANWKKPLGISLLLLIMTAGAIFIFTQLKISI